MNEIAFDEEKHEYRWNGQKIPSVSDILAPLSAERYGDINRAVLQQAAERGRAVHEICEAMDYGLEPEIEPGLEGYAQAYADFLRDYFPKWDMVEQIVFYRTGFAVYSDLPPEYCGTVDRYGKIDGISAVLDIKTYASLNTDSMISASCQTQLYLAAIESRTNDTQEVHYKLSKILPKKRYLLHLKKDGSYRLVDLGKFDAERDFESEKTAWDLVRIRRSIDRARWGKKKK